jgi:hypothetical protein
MYVIMYIYNYAYMYKISIDIFIGLHNIKYWDVVELSTHYDWEGEFPWIGFSNFEFHLLRALEKLCSQLILFSWYSRIISVPFERTGWKHVRLIRPSSCCGISVWTYVHNSSYIRIPIDVIIYILHVYIICIHIRLLYLYPASPNPTCNDPPTRPVWTLGGASWRCRGRIAVRSRRQRFRRGYGRKGVLW